MKDEPPVAEFPVLRPMPKAATGALGDLRVRIISGAVLAALAVGFCYLGALPFALLVGLIGVLMSWEWGRVVRGAEFDAVFYVHATAVVVATCFAVAGFAALSLAILAIGAIVLVPLKFGQGSFFSALGVFYVGLPALALLWLRGDEPNGFAAVLFIFLTVWTMDTFAFITGRAIGGPKLWPAVSPNKTWAGLIGGVSASAIGGGVFANVIGAPVELLAMTGFVLGVVAQAGDLAESALKRAFGVKDASALIPGHGGFLDRMDSFVPVAVVAALIAFAVDMRSPAQALLFGN